MSPYRNIPRRDPWLFLLVLLIGACGVGVGLYSVHTITSLRSTLAQRCVDRQATYESNLANLKGDLVSLQADAAFYRAQVRDVGKLGAQFANVAANYKTLLAARQENIVVKQQAIDAAEAQPPKCSQISQASGS